MNDSKRRPITDRLVSTATRIEALGNHYIFEPLGVSSAVIKILRVIEELEKPTPTEIMRYVGGSKSNVTQRLDGLERKGLIERFYASEASDKRKVRIGLTSKGWDFLTLTKQEVSQKSLCLEECFEAGEIRDWHAFMDKLGSVLQAWESCFDETCPLSKSIKK